MWLLHFSLVCYSTPLTRTGRNLQVIQASIFHVYISRSRQKRQVYAGTYNVSQQEASGERYTNMYFQHWKGPGIMMRILYRTSSCSNWMCSIINGHESVLFSVAAAFVRSFIYVLVKMQLILNITDSFFESLYLKKLRSILFFVVWNFSQFLFQYTFVPTVTDGASASVTNCSLNNQMSILGAYVILYERIKRFLNTIFLVNIGVLRPARREYHRCLCEVLDTLFVTAFQPGNASQQGPFRLNRNILHRYPLFWVHCNIFRNNYMAKKDQVVLEKFTFEND